MFLRVTFAYISVRVCVYFVSLFHRTCSKVSVEKTPVGRNRSAATVIADGTPICLYHLSVLHLHYSIIR